MRGCLARVACTDVSLVGMRQQLEEDFSRQVAEQTMELQEQLSNRSLQEQTLRAELLDLTTHWEEEKQREREAFEEQHEGMQREMEGMRCYYEAQMEDREAEIDRDLTDTRFSYECEISVLRQQLMDQGPDGGHSVEMLGGLTDQYDVEMSGPPIDQCDDYGFAGRTDPFENGVVSGPDQDIVSDVTGHAHNIVVDGTVGETGDFVEYEASDCSHANVSSEFGLGPDIGPDQEITGHADQVIVDGTEWGMGDTVEYEASDCSQANGSSEFGLGPDIGSDSSSVQELVGSDIESGDLQMEMQGYHEQMEHFREDSDREHLAAMSRLCAEMSEDQHKTKLELEAVKLEAVQEVKTAKCEAAQELETLKTDAGRELEIVKCEAAQELETLKTDAGRELEIVKCEAAQELETLKTDAGRELDTVKCEAAQELETVKCEAAQELETVKCEAAQELETVKCEAAQELETVKCEAAQELETVKCEAAQEIETVKCQAAQEIETVKCEAAQEIETVKCEAAQEIETVKCEAAQELETVKCEAAQELETVKCEAAQELETVKCEAAQELETVKCEAAQEIETVKCEAAQELETVKCEAAQELETLKCEAAQELETVKCQEIEDEQDLRRELRHSFVAQLEDMRSEMLTQQNEEMENWKNTSHSRDSRSCDQGLRSRSPTDGELIRTETGPKVATVGENIRSVVLQELHEGFESRTKIMEERHLIKLDEYQRQVDRLIGDKDEAERSRDELLEKMMGVAGDSESVVADGSSRGQLREKAALRKACWKLKAKLVECSAQIKAYWHVTDTPGDKVMQDEVENSGDAFCGGGGADIEQTEASLCQLNCVTDVTQEILHVSRDVDSLTHSVLGQQGW